MPDFRTELNIPRSAVRMAISDPIFTIGSCFADTIANRMMAYKLKTSANPTGILYNPAAIHRVLGMAVNNTAPALDHYTTGEVVFHYDFHSAQSATSNANLHQILEDIIATSRDALQHAKWLIITYGTAWVYRRKETGKIVANCHKQPASGFTKELLNVSEIEASFRDVIATLRGFNADLKVILTISPVRHVKDTLEGNSLSKSVLRVACENIVQAHNDVFYFPAYEIMLDDLRDYRFYKADMIHPSEVAEDYIWEKFAHAWFDDSLMKFIPAWKSILQAMQHRPFHPGTDAHQQFLRSTLQRIDAWSGYVNVNTEREQLLNQLLTQKDLPIP